MILCSSIHPPHLRPYHLFLPPFTFRLFLFTVLILSLPFPLHLLLTPSLSSCLTFLPSLPPFLPPSLPPSFPSSLSLEGAPRVLIFPRLLGRRKRRGNYHRPHFPSSSAPMLSLPPCLPSSLCSLHLPK